MSLVEREAREPEPRDLIRRRGDDDAGPKKPLAGARMGRAMTDTEFQGLVFDWATDARSYVDEFIAHERHDATEYYKGRLPDVDKDAAEEDRSTAVLTEVRDTVLGIMPDLLRIFFSADGVVKYNPVPCTDPQVYEKRCQEAAQATAYVQNVVLQADNPDSFLTFHDAFQDGLVRKTGFIKWFWQKTEKPIYSTHTGLIEEMVLSLAADDDIEIIGKREYQCQAPDGSHYPCYDVKIKRIEKRGHETIRAVPCENIIVARRGAAINRTSLFGMTEEKTAGDFLADGLIDDLEDLADCDNDPNDADNWEKQARRPQESSAVGPADDPPADPSMRIVKYGELYITADRDGDGIAELIRVVTAGTQYKILQEEPVDDVPFAAFCPYPEAHQFFGESVADLTRDIQRIKSRILRDTLDSLAQSVTPQTAVVEGQVNLDDALNPDTSKVVRMRQPGMVQPILIPFVGKEALPILDLLTQVRENRTGQSDASAGLDPGALQSSTLAAVQATLTKAQSRVEMIARIFAETGMRRLFVGILHDTIKNIDAPRAVRLSGDQLAIIDPRQWNAEMDVTPTIPLGRGSQADQVASLQQILQKQTEIITTLGPDNPICSLDQFSYTLKKLVELSGFRNTASFFNDLSALDPASKQQAIAKVQQSMAASAQGNKQGGPDPAIEQAKIASSDRQAQMKLQLEAMKEHANLQLEMLRLKAQMQMQVLQMMADKQQAMDQAAVNGHVERFNAVLDAHVRHHGNVMANATKLAIANLEPTAEAAE